MRPVAAGAAALVAALSAAACTLVNQAQANAPPAYTRSSISAYQVRPGARVNLVVVAADEDYDPLFYTWQALRLPARALDEIEALAPRGVVAQPEPLRRLYALLGPGESVGGFAAATAQTTNSWSAPATIQGGSERFLLLVTVRDRDCDAITAAAEQAACATGESQFVRVYTVTVA
jgi:hypothetical protein